MKKIDILGLLCVLAAFSLGSTIVVVENGREVSRWEEDDGKDEVVFKVLDNEEVEKNIQDKTQEVLNKTKSMTVEHKESTTSNMKESNLMKKELLEEKEQDSSDESMNKLTDIDDKSLLEDLLDTRKTLVSLMKESLTNEERNFLISVKKGEPKWDLLGITGVKDLPAVKWKLMNIKRMDKNKHKKALEKLSNYLEK